METDLVHSFISLFNKYLPGSLLGTGCAGVNTTHMVLSFQSSQSTGDKSIDKKKLANKITKCMCYKGNSQVLEQTLIDRMVRGGLFE